MGLFKNSQISTWRQEGSVAVRGAQTYGGAGMDPTLVIIMIIIVCVVVVTSGGIGGMTSGILGGFGQGIGDAKEGIFGRGNIIDFDGQNKKDKRFRQNMKKKKLNAKIASEQADAETDAAFRENWYGLSQKQAMMVFLAGCAVLIICVVLYTRAPTRAAEAPVALV